MRQYLDLLQHVLDHGVKKTDRTGTGTLSVFGYQMRFNLDPDGVNANGEPGGFPLVTTKKCHTRSIIHELLWFLRGQRNIRPLLLEGVRIWSDWPFQKYLDANDLSEAYPTGSEVWRNEKKQFEQRVVDDEAFAEQWGDLGPVYGHQWRSWPTPMGATIDQIKGLVDRIKTSPDSRRLIVSAWNVSDVDQMALPPCHTMFQFYVAEGRLSCQLYQRSADLFLGVPFNIASYALLTMMVAQVTGLKPGDFVHTFGDAHLYLNHLEQTREQLTREPRPLPTMKLNPAVDDLFAFTFDDFELVGYEPHPHIAAPVAV